MAEGTGGIGAQASPRGRGRERVASRELEGWLIEMKGPSVVEEQSRTGAIGERSQYKKKRQKD